MEKGKRAIGPGSPHFFCVKIFGGVVNMMTWAIFTLSVVALLSPAARNESFDNDSFGDVAPTLLALPIGGAPLSFEQVEEISLTNPDGTAVVKKLRSNVYRDADGRLLIQGLLPPSTNSTESPYLDFIDPVSRSRVFILVNEGIGYRFPLPQSPEGGLNFFFTNSQSSDERSPMEKLGERTIEGVEFDGIQFKESSKTGSTVLNTREQWYSEDLKLLGSVIVSSVNRTHTIRIQNLQRQAPDPQMFTIPNKYKIIDQ